MSFYIFALFYFFHIFAKSSKFSRQIKARFGNFSRNILKLDFAKNEHFRLFLSERSETKCYILSESIYPFRWKWQRFGFENFLSIQKNMKDQDNVINYIYIYIFVKPDWPWIKIKEKLFCMRLMSILCQQQNSC